MNTKTIIVAGALAFASAVSTPAFAGKGGSNDRIVAAVNSGSVAAIISEVERTESLMCPACETTVGALTADPRYAVRQVAAWWFAKRPGLAAQLSEVFAQDLESTDSIKVRNAADYLGTVQLYATIPLMQQALAHSGLTSEARLALVHALGDMVSLKTNPALIAAMADSDPQVRADAIIAYRNVLGQTDGTPALAHLGDPNANVREQAAAAVGAFPVHAAIGQLEQLATSDADARVRRNAAWALGKIGDPSAREALTIASQDHSGLVRGVAHAALASLPMGGAVAAAPR